MAEQKHNCNQWERILTLELTNKQMVTDIWDIKKEVKDISVAQKSNHEMVMLKFESLDVKYAPKSSVAKLWVIVRSIIGFVFTALGTAIMVLLLNR